MVKVYVAASWRSAIYPNVVDALRTDGHNVYDYRDPEASFHWADIDPNWESWAPDQFRNALRHNSADMGFVHDMNALEACDACVMVAPGGRSAHLELGWAVGASKRTCILMSDQEFRPELMYKMVELLTTQLEGVRAWLFSL